MNKKIILTEGSDRYGAHITRYIIDYIYFNLSQNDIYISTKFKYFNRLFFIPFKSLCKHTNENPVKDLHPDNNNGYVGHVIKLVKEISCDIPSYFNKYYKTEFSKLINIQHQINKIICVHLRLDDETNYIPKYENLKYKANNVLEHINSNFQLKLDNNVLEPPTMWIRQHNTNLDKLNIFIKHLQNKYKNYEIHIVASPKGNVIFPQSFNNFKILRNLSEDDSLLYMIKSEILVLSASTFAFTAGLFHGGSKIYYPLWNHYYAYGLNSKFDHSGWEMFDINNY